MTGMRTGALAAMAALVAVTAFGQDTTPPKVSVLVNGVAADGSKQVTIRSMDDLAVGVVDTDGASSIQSATMTDRTGAVQVLTVNTSAAALNQPLTVSIADGKGKFEIVSDTCSGAKLGPSSDPSGTCSIAVRAVATDNGTATGVLRIAHPSKTFDVPLSSTVTGMTQGVADLSGNQTCAANRQTSVACGSFTVTNTGGFAIKNIAVVKTGADADKFAYTHNCPASLTKGQTCTITAKAVGLTDNGTFSDSVAVSYASEGTGAWAGQTLTSAPRENTVTVTGWAAKIAYENAVGTGMDVTGPGDPAYGTQRRFAVKNVGEITSGAVSVSVVGNDYEIVTNECEGRQLAAGATCAVDVRPKASGNGKLAGTLRTTLSGVNTDLALSGIAQGWKPPLLSFVAANGNGMDVDGPGAPAYGAERAFQVRNDGDLPTQAITVTLGTSNNFELIGSNTCANATLKAAQVCTVTVRPKATAAGTYSTTLRVVQGSNTADLGLSGTARKFAPPSLVLAATDGNATLMDVTGPGAPAYGLPVTFTLTNNGDFRSNAIAFALTNSANFEFGPGATCVSGTTKLDGGTSCTIIVRPKATNNGTLVGALNVTGDNNPSVALNGTSVGFKPAELVFVDAAGYGMDVVGPGTPAYGNPKTFWVRNAGDLPTKAVAVALSALTNFEITAQTCAGATLQPADSCSVTVRPKATAAGQINATLNATQGTQSVALQLDGKASAFAPASLTIAATNGNPSAMGVTGPGNPARGSAVTFTVSNTGDFASQKIGVSLTNTDNFEVSGGSCVLGTTQLAGGANCTIDVTPKATASGPFVGEIKVTADNQPKFGLGGTATNFNPALLAFADANGSGLDVVGPGAPAYGLERTLNVTNKGELTSAALTVALTSSANFDITDQNCAGAKLAGGASCWIKVRPKASTGGAYTATLRATQGSNTVDLPLTGTASGFAPANLLVAVTSGSASEMNVVGPGAPAYGTAITATVTNTGDFRSDTLAYTLTNTTNFDLVTGGTCVNGSTQLDGKASCTIKVRPKATASGTIAGSLTLTANNNPTLALSGTASNFTPASIVFVAANGSGMDVIGPGAPAYGTTRTFTLRNDGELTSAALSVALSTTDNFAIAAGGTCASGTTTLAKGATCTVNVQPKATANGAISTTLNVTQAGATTSLGLTGSAQRFDAANLVIAATSGNISAMNVVGPGTPAYSTPAELTITNTGDFPSATLGLALSNTTNFQFVAGGTCVSGSTTLAGKASCTVKVRALATANGAYTGELRVSGNNAPVAGMTGTASNFNPADLVFASASGSGMDVVGPGNPAYGLDRTFTVRNQGEWTSAAISVSLTNTTNFDITSQTCAGATLAGGATCDITVRPKASAGGTYSGVLRVTQAAKNTDLPLSGTASKFAPASLIMAATSGNPTAMAVVGPGSPAYGAAVTISVTNSGDYTASPLAFGLTNTTNFEFVSGGSCVAGSTQLAGGASCTIKVRSKTNATGSFAGELAVTSDNKPSLGLSGSGSNFIPSTLVYVSASGSGMDVVGPGNPAYGLARSFTVQNVGELTSGALTVGLNNAANFDIVSETCSTKPLTANATCSVSVRPKASSGGTISTTLRVTENGAGSIDTALSGTASNFAPTDLTISVVSGNPTGMNVTGPGNPAYGNTVTFKIQNNGDFTSDRLSFIVSNATNFQIVSGGTCVNGSTQLASGGSCTILVRPKATASGSYSGELQITANNSPVAGLSGTASNFTTANLVFVEASGAGMDVIGPGSPAYGADRLFTVRNSGELTSGAITTTLTSLSNFDISAQTCGGSTLAGGATCTITVRPKASAEGSIASTLRVTQNSKVTDLALSGAASHFASPSLVIAASGGDPANMGVSGPGNPAYGSTVTFTITNTGDQTSATLILGLSNPTNFEFVNGGSCVSGSTKLTGGSSCTVNVRPKATANGSLAGFFTVTANNNPSIPLVGAASSFKPAQMVFVSADGSAMDVTGPGTPAYGAERTFTLRNDGDLPSGALTVSLTSTTNFEVASQTCAGATLAGGTTCTIGVRPKASAAGSIASTLRVTQGGVNTDLALSGTATKFDPGALALTASSGDPANMNVTGPGNPAYGGNVVFTVANTGDFSSGTLKFSLSNTTNYEFVSGGTCVDNTTVLAGHTSCTVVVRPKASASGSYTGSLAVAANNNPTAALAGTASGFLPANLVFVSPNTSGMDVVGPGDLVYGSARSFTLRNDGEQASGPVLISINGGNFDLVDSGNCTWGASLTKGASCTFTVRPKATWNGSIGATVTITQNGVGTTMNLSGTASGFYYNICRAASAGWCEVDRTQPYKLQSTYMEDARASGCGTSPETKAVIYWNGDVGGSCNCTIQVHATLNGVFQYAFDAGPGVCAYSPN
ncbi:beta strand repeat-containing protein [Azospirillum sp. sgz302134]